MTNIHLIDASPYIFRAYFSLPSSITSPGGLQVNAVYGYTAFLIDVLKKENPTHLAVAFDGSLTTSFRNDFYPEYKAQRELPDQELTAQLDACREMTQALGMKTYIDDRYEADDIIGTIRQKLRRDGRSFVVLSNDKDLSQLVDRDTIFWDYAKDRRMDNAGVLSQFGVHAWQIIDLLGLMGDKIDNIPGVPGIGKKTAVALLTEFDSLEDIYARLDQIEQLSLRGAKSIRHKLEENRELAFLSRKLATIATDAPVKSSLRELEYRGPDQKAVDEICNRLGFNKIRDRIPS